MTPKGASLGEQIRSARVAKGIGLRELARLIDKSPSYVTDIEYDRRVPSEGVLASLCVALDLDFDRMLALAGRLGNDTDRYLKREPAAGILLRRAQESGLKDKDLRALIDRVDEMARRKPKRI